MAAGPLQNFLEIYEKIQRNHFHMIKFIGLKVGLEDVTPVAFQDIHI